MSGCFSVKRIPYNATDFANIKKSGTGIVTGQLFLKTRGGDIKFGAGNKIQLDPVTNYSLQWYKESYLKHHKLSPPDPRYLEHIIKTISDGDGRFTFRNVPAGDYFCIGGVFWEISDYAFTPEGSWIAKRITVEKNKKIEVILTR